MKPDCVLLRRAPREEGCENAPSPCALHLTPPGRAKQEVCSGWTTRERRGGAAAKKTQNKTRESSAPVDGLHFPDPQQGQRAQRKATKSLASFAFSQTLYVCSTVSLSVTHHSLSANPRRPNSKPRHACKLDTSRAPVTLPPGPSVATGSDRNDRRRQWARRRGCRHRVGPFPPGNLPLPSRIDSLCPSQGKHFRDSTNSAL